MMTRKNALLSHSAVLAVSAATLGLTLGAVPIHAQDNPPAVDNVEQIVVTGSRIRRSATDTATPLSIIDPKSFEDRGFVQAGQALNQSTSINPSQALTTFNGQSSGSGQQYPALFGLGAGRTLTLVNGRRFVSSASAMGDINSLAVTRDAAVDTNLIPVGLIERVDIVQAGGAAVYGSDAVAGVVNYVLKDHFNGFEFDAQTSIATHGDYPVHNMRGTYGTDFADARGNIAFNVEWSKSDPLFAEDRAETALFAGPTVPNPANRTATDGLPSVLRIYDPKFWPFNTNGVIFTTPAPVPDFILRVNGTPTQFNPDGSLASYNPGQVYGVPFAEGGQGFPFAGLGALLTGVERTNFNTIGHYDITDNIKFSVEGLYGRTKGRDPRSAYISGTVLNNAASGSGVIAFTRTNPFLTPATIAALSAAAPSFGAGAPLFLSKLWPDLPLSREAVAKTETYRGVTSLDGEFTAAERDFYWSLSYSYGLTDGTAHTPQINQERLARALAATRNAAGQIVCGVNADAVTTNDDAACVPLNPFGAGNAGPAAAAYLSTDIGQDYKNIQRDYLATIGGPLFALPAGDVKFSAAYEHRIEKANYDPTEAARLGLTGSRVPVLPGGGKYDTDEFSGELLVPLLGDDFTLPGAQMVEATGAYRRVTHSIAGSENVWSVGGRWQLVDDVTLRGSRSRNFRAPSLDQLFAPQRTALGAIAQDPCDADRITGGSSPATRLANCRALFAANPQWGPLATFQDPSENFVQAQITSGGNPTLQNEVSKTTTFGIVLQPRFIPGLTVVADRIKVRLTNGLSLFTSQNFLATCFDSSPQPAIACSQVIRDPATGYVTAGRTTTFNAGRIQFRGETYNVDYVFDVADAFASTSDLGTLGLTVEATHTTLADVSVTGFDLTRNDDTILQPRWVTRFDARWTRGPVRLTYQALYRASAKQAPDSTIENTPTPIISDNLVQSVSGAYAFDHVTVRAGVNNVFNSKPSYPTVSYGDIIGRTFYAGVKVNF